MRAAAIGLVLFLSSAGDAMELECPVSRKVTAQGESTDEDLQRWRFSIRIEETPEGSFVSRCSLPEGAEEVSCKRYAVAHVATDRRIGAKKYYLFRSLYDVEVFRDNRFIENNGRGSIAFGTCTLTSP